MRSTQLWVSLAILLLPGLALASLWGSGRADDVVFEVDLHQSVALLTAGIAIGVGVLLLTTYVQGGERSTGAVAAGFLAFAGFYALDGLAPTADVEAARFAYGAGGRLLLVASLLSIFAPAVMAQRHRRRVALLILVGVAGVLGLGYALAGPLAGSSLEWVDALVGLMALAVLTRVLWTRRRIMDPSPAPILGTGWLLLQSLFLSLADAWTLPWWGAQYVGVGGILAIGWGLLVVPAAPRRVEELRQEVGSDRLNLWLINNAIFGMRTPLTPMKLQLHILRKNQGPDAPKEFVQSIDVLERNVDRLSRMVDTVLDFARIQAGKLEVRRISVGLNSVLGETLTQFQPTADQNGVRLVLDIAGEVRVAADSARVAQVASNLLTNALGFTPKGGEVRVATRKEGGFGVCEVSDTGVGLTPAQVVRFNLPLSGLPQAGEGPDAGIGLGLFIAKGVVEQMGGRFSCASPGPGRGAAFRFALPLAESAPQEGGSGFRSRAA